MDDNVSVLTDGLLAKLRSLARRGAVLLSEHDGPGEVVHTCGGTLARPASRSSERFRMSAQEVRAVIERGWVKECTDLGTAGTGASASASADAGAGARYVLSKRGASMLRAELGRTAAEAAATAPRAQPGPAPEAPSGATSPPRAGHDRRPDRAARPQVNPRESPLAWLRQRRDKDGQPMIPAVEFEAGERLRADFETAGMTPRITASWDPTAGGRQSRAPDAALTVGEAAIAAQQRINLAMRAVGPTLSGVLVDVCCLLQGVEQAERNGGWPRRAGKVVLRIALEALACHYGMITMAHDGGRFRGRHWGAPGYRPTLHGNATTDDAQRSEVGDQED